MPAGVRARFSFRGTRQMSERITGWSRKVDEEVRDFADALSNEMARHARDNHPWTNRTGHAEEGLTPYVSHDPGTRHRAGVRQKFEGYPQILEAPDWPPKRPGYWRIVWPTLVQFMPRWRQFLSSRGFR
jgi:hypothetical protein